MNFKLRAVAIACLIATTMVPALAAETATTNSPVQLYDKIISVVQNEFYDDRARTPAFKRTIAEYRTKVKTREDAITNARAVITTLGDRYTWLMDRTLIQKREAKRSGVAISPPVKMKVQTPQGAVVERPVQIVSERKSVEADWLTPDTAYLQISDFDNRLLPSQLQRAVTTMNIATAKNLVLDLRRNAGGFVTAAAQVLGFVMGSAPNIASLRMAKGVQPLSLNWPKTNPQFRGKLVVLVDHHTASASELVAATVQKMHRGKIVGVKTAGSNTWKGEREIEPGLVLYIAFAEWKISPTPFTGVIPDVVVHGGPQQMQAAVKALQE